MIITLIFLVLCINIGPIRLLENSAFNAKFEVDKRLHAGSTGLDWDNSAKIEEAITADKDNKDKEKDFQNRNRHYKMRSNV